jgi:hypothetical protein
MTCRRRRQICFRLRPSHPQVLTIPLPQLAAGKVLMHFAESENGFVARSGDDTSFIEKRRAGGAIRRRGRGSDEDSDE